MVHDTTRHVTPSGHPSPNGMRRELPSMHESPRLRRLRSDLIALERLRDESSVLRFRASGNPANHYIIDFHGKSLARTHGKVSVTTTHQVEIKLGASYPRTMPEIRWLSPIYHPNISEIGMVCLGGYGTHWVPSLNLDELCGMLWDMARYHNYDVRSPYNRDAALWVANQATFTFPIDPRPLRDLRAALGRVEHHEQSPAATVAEPDAGQAGYRGRYAAFVRKFATDLRSVTPTGTLDPNPPSPEADRLIFLDEPSFEPVPSASVPTPRLRAADEEILFIE